MQETILMQCKRFITCRVVRYPSFVHVLLINCFVFVASCRTGLIIQDRKYLKAAPTCYGHPSLGSQYCLSIVETRFELASCFI